MVRPTTQAAWFALLAILAFTQAPASQAIPRPEHPLPQMQRAEWMTLNGEWQFAETNDSADDSFLTADEYPETILVPFCRESELSGIGRTGFMKNVWYRRTFEVPADWQSERIRLHFNACDWLTRVWVNGTQVGTHEGGFSHFAFDITDALRDGENTVVIHAFDDTESGMQPLGKQSIREESYGIFYTRTTGIWQPVWLEGVGESFIDAVRMVPEPDESRLLLQADIDGSNPNLVLEAEAFMEGQSVGAVSSPVKWRNNHLMLDLDEVRLWSIDDPFLYDLTLTLRQDGEVIDQVESYFGLRTVSIQGRAILLNGEPVFQRLVLDQGFYPDGIWTAPSDEALRKDIEMAQAAGFNGARLHQKVFEPRFLYWADQMGYLVWGEYPSYGADYSNPAVNRPIIDEWVQLLRRDFNHPSIIGWCAFNETPASAGELQNTIVDMTKRIDPTRPVLDTSGWTHSHPNPEVLDAHDYDQNPETFRQRWMNYFETPALPARYGDAADKSIPFFVSEFGGIGWFEDPQGESWGYGNNPTTEEEFFERFRGLVEAQLENRNLFGYCYTQLTDIEQEKNGVYTYARENKFAPEKFAAIQQQTAAYEENPPLRVEEEHQRYHVLLGAAPDGMAQNRWRYTMTEPAEGWMNASFDDSAWQEGVGGFGQKESASEWIGTEWTHSDIWLRRTFSYDGNGFDRALLVTHFDNATTVYVNGEQVWQREGWNDGYEGFEVTEALEAALVEGENEIAIHCHQDGGGQFIDAALLLMQ